MIEVKLAIKGFHPRFTERNDTIILLLDIGLTDMYILALITYEHLSPYKITTKIWRQKWQEYYFRF